MNTMKMNIVRLFFLFGFFWISLYSNSQDNQLSRQEQKEVRKAQRVENFYVLDSLLNGKSFVLEADYLQNKYGDRVPVTSTLNFIKVDKSKGVLQTGSDIRMGTNGVGGVTAEGSIGAWEISKNLKTLSHTVRFSLLTSIGNFDIFMTVSADNYASATITGSTSGRLSWNGHLRSINNSRVFKGQNTI